MHSFKYQYMKGVNIMGIKKAKDCETVEEVYACLKQLDEEKRLIDGPGAVDRW